MGRGAERWLRVAMAEPAEEEELPVPGESGDGPLCPLLPAGGGDLVRPVPFLAVPASLRPARRLGRVLPSSEGRTR